MNSPVEKIAPYHLLHGSGVHHFQIDNGLLVAFSGVQTSGFIIENLPIDESKIRLLIKEAQTIVGSSQFQEIKLIGDMSLAKRLDSILSTHGPLKYIPKIGCNEIIFYPDQNRIRVAAAELKPVVEIHVAPKVNLPTKKLRVLIVDDSKTIRILLRKILEDSPKIEIVGDTGDPLEVIDLIKQKKPDVITLDIHMPKMDGLTLLKKYIHQYPIPTVMVTSISFEEGPTVLNALEAGAVDYIEKPEMNELAEASEAIIDKIVSAGAAQIAQKTNAPVQTSLGTIAKGKINIDSIIAIGASTGGTEALRVLLTRLPEEIPPIVIVQHIPAGFSNAFAKRLNSLCPFEVIEAQDHDEIKKGRVLIAPGGKQMRAVCKGSKWHVVIDDSPPINRHKPSVDYLFNSLAEFQFKNPVGIILTGMGGDGAKGLLSLKNKGWATIAQNKESCVVFGMPAVAIELGAAQHICSIDTIPHKIQQLLPVKKSA